MQIGGWNIEPELTGATPRRTRWSVPIRNLRIVLRALIVIVCGIAAANAYQDISTLNQLRAHGVTILGTVTGKYIIADRGANLYHIQYRYLPPGANTHFTGDSEVTPDQYNAQPERFAIALTYLPNKPHVSRIGGVPDAGSIQQKVGYWAAIVCFCSVFIVALIMLVETEIRGQQRLLQYGKVEPAEIVNLEPLNPNQLTLPYKLRYRYSTTSGDSVEGTVAVYADYAAKISGCKYVTVLIDSRNQRKHKLYIAFKAVLIDTESKS